MSVLLVGFGLGFAVALQVGPLSLFAIRSTLRGGLMVGLAIGAAVAIVDTLYAAAGAAGAAGLLSIDPLRLAFGIVGAIVLITLGVRTLWSAFRVRSGGESSDEVASPRKAFTTALAATASNPLTIASWAAIFAAATTAGATGATTAGSTGGTAGSIAAAGSTTTAEATALLLTGIGLGSLTWMCLLTAGVSLARRGIGARFIRAVDVVAGTGLLAFGGLLAARTLHDD
jgi:putative LysE/RhtB family amino acid efflux pump